ncbi:hypothetical protein PORY_002799 [Pneumocystis oryctolagi]|uniref:Uncharacterized protein n=1 Tax=Pneumocystis oryctolagi TaxID=42067 RepID=A0ACB7C8G6_9ASCO|nr:hypothetical protein PORY_002799 [Pneumocystis oryctolagi]
MSVNILGVQSKSLDIITNDQDNNINQISPSRNVQAYAKLEFDAFSFYVQTLQVIIGRKASKSDQVDVHIGSAKAISRQHAKLFYDFTSQRFEIFVMGKNGAFVNEQFVECGKTIPLYDKTKIQIGKVFFTFLLPNSTGKENNENKKNINTDQVNVEQLEFPEDDSESLNNNLTKLSCTAYSSVELEPNSIETHKSSILPASSNIMDDDVSELMDLGDNFYDESVFSQDKLCDISIKEHNKPNLSYASLIAQAILSSPAKKMTLSDIYEWIAHTYKYYKYAQNGWQNSIRHSLSLNKAFKKVFRRNNEPGKGSFWTIDSEYRDQFESGVYKRNRKDIISSSLQYTTSDSSTIADNASLESLSDSASIVIMQDGQLSLNPAYFNNVNNNNDSNKVKIVQAIVFLQRYVITQLGPHAKNPQNAAAIANALIVALDQQLQKQKNHKDFISTTFKNLTSLLPNTSEKKSILSNDFSIKDKQYISESFTPLIPLTQIPRNSDVSKMASSSSISQSYSINDKLDQLYPVQIPPPPPYYSKSQISNVTNHTSSNLTNKKECTQVFSSEECLVDSLNCRKGCKRSHENNENSCFIGERKVLLGDSKCMKS